MNETEITKEIQKTELKINNLIKELEISTGVQVLIFSNHEENKPRVTILGAISHQEIHSNTSHKLTKDLENYK